MTNQQTKEAANLISVCFGWVFLISFVGVIIAAIVSIIIMSKRSK